MLSVVLEANLIGRLDRAVGVWIDAEAETARTAARGAAGAVSSFDLAQ